MGPVETIQENKRIKKCIINKKVVQGWIEFGEPI